MAASLKGREIAGSFGKRLAEQIWVSAPKPKDPRSRRVAVAHYSSSSYYDKNVDDQVRPAVVPDHVIDSKSDKYWGPHPKTGVFGPADPNSSTAGGDQAALRKSGDGSSSSSVLNQTAWFRPLEDVDKPPVA